MAITDIDTNQIDYIKKGDVYNVSTFNKSVETAFQQIESTLTDIRNLEKESVSQITVDNYISDIQNINDTTNNHNHDSRYFNISNNLSEGDPTQMFDNLGFGTMALENESHYRTVDIESTVVFSGSESSISLNDMSTDELVGIYGVRGTSSAAPFMMITILGSGQESRGTIETIPGGELGGTGVRIFQATFDGSFIRIEYYDIYNNQHFISTIGEVVKYT